MKFSVPTSGGYAYYEGVAQTPATGWYRRPRGTAIQSMYTPEQFAAALPSATSYVGTGRHALGMIATRGGPLGGPEDEGNTWTRRLMSFGAAFGLGWLIGKFLR